MWLAVVFTCILVAVHKKRRAFSVSRAAAMFLIMHMLLFHMTLFVKFCVCGLLKGEPLTFPNSEEDTFTPHCRDNFCEKLEDYPSEVFYDILQHSTYGEKYRQYFENLKENEAILLRSNQKNVRNFICVSNKSVVYPRAAYNLKQELKFIFNLDGYRQGIAIEVCVKKGKCKFYDKIGGIRTKCVQKFAEKKLLTADNEGRPYVDVYKFPAACVCAYKEEHSLSRLLKFYK